MRWGLISDLSTLCLMHFQRQHGNMHGMNAELSELLRLILNLIRVGAIVDIDHAAQRVRVQVGKNITAWRPWVAYRAGAAQTWWPPSKGEQVILLSPEGNFDNAVVLPAVYCDQFPAPSANPAHHTARYADGAVIQYDSEEHALTAVLPDGTRVSVTPGTVTSHAKETICTGNLTVKKNLTVNGLTALNAGMNVKAGKGGASTAVIEGTLHATEDVVAGSISLVKHRHGNVKNGGGKTGGPQ